MLRFRRKHESGFALSVLARTHELLFLERYERLCNWAGKFTGSKEDAIDVVHDAYVMFTLKKPDISKIANLDAYLCTMIRNLHVSLIRRRASKAVRNLMLVDYDSCQASLRAADPTLRVHSEQQLSLICNFACVRKATTKAASVLILRFFHGFYPGEIARILRCSRQTVEVSLCHARRETKANCEQLERVHPGGAAEVRPPSQDVTSWLRGKVFDARSGNCLPHDHLRRLYAAHEHDVFNCEHLAHVVSCRACLDAITETLGITPLDRRRPEEFIEGTGNVAVTEERR